MSQKDSYPKQYIAQSPTSASAAASGQSGRGPASQQTVQAFQSPTNLHSAAGPLLPTATLEQQRAAHALQQVNAVCQQQFATDYKSYTEGLSATIVMNGLGQATATLLAQAGGKTGTKDAHRRLFDSLEDWLTSPLSRVGLQKPLMVALVNSDQSTYCHAQAEALAYLVWLKKFAQAFLGKAERVSKESRDEH